MDAKKKNRKKKRKANTSNEKQKSGPPVAPLLKKKKSKKNKKTKKKKPLVKALRKGTNPFLAEYKKATEKFPQDMDQLLDPKLKGGDIRRALLFEMLPDEMPERYAWAVPDSRALNIIAHFGPVIEIACGAGYWGRMLLDRGVDWIGYDTRQQDEAWANVKLGGPAVLKDFQSRALMLCYPDDFEESMESIAMTCLEEYAGDVVIHIGEMVPNTIMENPWGKTTSSDFQLELAHGFHKVVQVPLPSWPSSVDCLSVWKRSQRTKIDDMELRYIPKNERLDLVQVSSSTAHLV
uniref:Methyltransferase domain-containing protein n=1 Tax=Lotharella globosa TaxID=91324 RepID=A0A6U2XFV3_9EUKA